MSVPEQSFLTLAKDPVMSPNHIMDAQLQGELADFLSVGASLERLSAESADRVSAQLAAGKGIAAPVPGYAYLYSFGTAVGMQGPHFRAIGDYLVHAKPNDAQRLGTYASAMAVESSLDVVMRTAPEIASDTAHNFLSELSENGAVAYRAADRKVAASTADYLLLHPDERDERAKDIVAAHVAMRREGLTDREASDRAATYWRRLNQTPPAARASNAGYELEEIIGQMPEAKQADNTLEGRLANASVFVVKVTRGAERDATELTSSSAADHFLRGARLATAFIALATQEFENQVARA